jgi:hypothetical protein
MFALWHEPRVETECGRRYLSQHFVRQPLHASSGSGGWGWSQRADEISVSRRVVGAFVMKAPCRSTADSTGKIASEFNFFRL